VFDFKYFLYPLFSSLLSFFLFCFISLMCLPLHFFLFHCFPPCIHLQFYLDFWIFINPFLKKTKIIVNGCCAFSIWIEREPCFYCHIHCPWTSQTPNLMKLHKKGGTWVKLGRPIIALQFISSPSFPSPHAFSVLRAINPFNYAM